MERNLGKDITKMFDKIEAHDTKSTMRDLESFCIGTVKLSDDNTVVQTETITTHNIDLKRGILWQVFQKLNLEQYLEFIHDPKHMINPPEVILFLFFNIFYFILGYYVRNTFLRNVHKKPLLGYFSCLHSTYFIQFIFGLRGNERILLNYRNWVFTWSFHMDLY